MMPFEPTRTLFVDDNRSVLDAAKAYGIRWLLAVLRPDSKGPLKHPGDYPAIHDFSEVMAGLNAFCNIFPDNP
jgi:putative hydrolase of the HAD superfamily